MTIPQMHKQQNRAALRLEVMSHQWSVAETASELKSDKIDANRSLALALLKEKRKTAPTKLQIKSQMRTIQRWENYERGITKQSAKPSPAARALLDKVRNQKLARDGFSIKLSGEIAVQGYRRNRNAFVDLSGPLALSFLKKPNYQDLGRAYLNDKNSLYGFGEDLEVQLVFEGT